ncbi:Ras association domain-containing protein 10, partial [Bienertia sinuspersici]
VPPSGNSNNNWIKLVNYWHSEKGASFVRMWKKGTSLLKSEDGHGEKMSLLALWIKSHKGKDGSYLFGTVTDDFMDDVNAKDKQLRLKYPTKSQLELENETFKEPIYLDEFLGRPLSYELVVKKGDIYGRNIITDSVKEEIDALHQRNDKVEKEKKIISGSRCSSLGEIFFRISKLYITIIGNDTPI